MMDPIVRQSLDRILVTKRFGNSPRLSRFLEFVVERAGSGAASEIKESVIAAEVYGRGADYDPQKDSLVRAEASRLRRALAEYYAGEGATDRVRIEIPRGSYVPKFSLMDPATTGEGVGGESADFVRRKGPWLLAGTAGVLILMAGGWALWRSPAPQGPGPETVQLYLRAADMLEAVYDKILPAGGDSAELRETLRLAESVTRTAPEYAPGWALLAKAGYRMARSDRGRFDEWMGRSREAAKRAIALDDHQALPWTLLGRILFFVDWDLDGAERAYRKGIPLNPLDAEAVPEFFDLLRFRGKHREAQSAVGTLLGQAAQSSPLRAQQARLLIELGRLEEAESIAETALSGKNPAAWMHQVKARCALRRQDRAAALGHLHRALEIESNHRGCLHLIGMHYARQGEREQAKEVLSRLERLPARGANVEYSMAVIWMMLGDSGQALRWLREGLQYRDPAMVYFRDAVADGEPWGQDFVKSEAFQRMASTYPAWSKLLNRNN